MPLSLRTQIKIKCRPLDINITVFVDFCQAIQTDAFLKVYFISLNKFISFLLTGNAR